jgi:hypothetical protein
MSNTYYMRRVKKVKGIEDKHSYGLLHKCHFNIQLKKHEFN